MGWCCGRARELEVLVNTIKYTISSIDSIHKFWFRVGSAWYRCFQCTLQCQIWFRRGREDAAVLLCEGFCRVCTCVRLDKPRKLGLFA